MENLYELLHDNLQIANEQYNKLRLNHESWVNSYSVGEFSDAKQIKLDQNLINDALDSTLNDASIIADKIINTYDENQKLFKFKEFIKKYNYNSTSYEDFLNEPLNYAALQTDIISKELDIMLSTHGTSNNLEFVIDNM